MKTQSFRIFNPRPSARLQLVCFPHAGGGASTFHQWAIDLPDFVELVALQLPGREVRLRDAPVSSYLQLRDPLLDDLKEVLRTPYLTFGHSFGAALSYALIRDAGSRIALPGHMILSAASPPVATFRSHRTISDEELENRLRELGGTPPEILANPGFLKMILPALRADLEILRGGDLAGLCPLPIAFSTFAGSDDRAVAPHEVTKWAALSSVGTAHHIFEGGHFFLHQNRDEVISEVVRVTETVS